MRLRSSIQTKLFVLISALCVAITLALTVGGWHWYASLTTRALEAKALTYGQLVSQSVESAVAFDDHETAREAFDDVMVDKDVSGAALFRADGSTLEARGEIGSMASLAVAQPTIEHGVGTVSCRAPVVSKEGRRGVVVVVLSTATIDRQIAALRVRSAIVTLVIIASGCLLAWWLSRGFARRIGRISAEVVVVASGELGRPPVSDGSADEVGQLVGAFNTMVREREMKGERDASRVVNDCVISTTNRRIVLVDPDNDTRAVYAARLRSQDFTVDEAADGVAGAEMALAAPPAAVVCDLWMAGVSGVQLCRLLKAEPATADVPVILRAEHEDPYSRFWARRAGASSLVSKDRMGDLMRALALATTRSETEGAFFFEMSGRIDVRDRIAQHLDRALFDSVIAAEVRALASACSFDRLFDSLSQLLAQLVTYRWLALITTSPNHFGIHANRRCAEAAENEVRAALSAPDTARAVRVLDADAVEGAPTGRTIVLDVVLGDTSVARVAISIPAGESQVDAIAPIVAHELGGPIRLAVLMEESHRLATTDGLTSLLNRRAFGEIMDRELSRCDRCNTPASLLLIDLDHFKVINDTRGHAAGDAVLAAVGKLLRTHTRQHDVVARWGGEEFVIALPGADAAGGQASGESLRSAIAQLVVLDGSGEAIPLTASIGVAERLLHEALDVTVDRADRAMYSAKVGGRNRVCVAGTVDQVNARESFAAEAVPPSGPMAIAA